MKEVHHLPLHRLFVQLQTIGIFVGTAERLHIQRLLTESNGEWLSEEGRENLKYKIAPIICRHRVEQEAFYKLFDAYSNSLVEINAWPIKKGKSKWTDRFKWVAIFLAFALLIFGIYFFLKSHFSEESKVSAVSFQEISGKKSLGKLGDKEFTDLAKVLDENILYDSAFLELPYGDSAFFQNKTILNDTAGVKFRWVINEFDSFGNSKYRTEESELLKLNTPNLDKGKSYIIAVGLNAIEEKNGESKQISSKSKVIAVCCPNKPEVKDSIHIKGSLLVGEWVKFFPPQDIKKYWKTEWALQQPFGEKKIIDSEHLFTQEGYYKIVLTLTDTTQKGYCSVVLTTNVLIKQNSSYLKFKEKSIVRYNWHYTPLVIISAGIILLLSLYFFWRWNGRAELPAPQPKPIVSNELIKSLELKEQPPYQIPYRSNNAYIKLVAEQFEVANILRRRQEGLQLNLNIPKSISATIEKMGFPSIQFAQSTQPSHYLFLVDLQNETSHLARLFQYLVEMLIGQEIQGDVFFYKNDFRHLWNRFHPEGISFEQLMMHYADRRLIIFGNAHYLCEEELIDQKVNQNWVEGLKHWKQRMLITPIPISSWAFQEVRLYQLLAVFPANLSGIVQASQFVDNGMDDEMLPPTFAEWEKHCLKSRIDTDTDRSWKTPADHRAYLRSINLEEPLYRWLRALVVYPESDWNITLAIGKALGIELNYEYLLVLARIPWLQEGTIKHSLWKAWLKELPESEERIARAAVQVELQAVVEKCRNGYADQKLQIRMALQEFALHPEKPATQDSIKYILSNIGPSPLFQEELKYIVLKRDPKLRESENVIEAFFKAKTRMYRPFFTYQLDLGIICFLLFLIPLTIHPSLWNNYLLKYPELVSKFVVRTVAESSNSCLNDLPQRKNVLDEIRRRDEIRVLVESDAPPFNYIEGKDTLGFDYEIAKAIAKELGISKVTMIHDHGLDYSEFPCAFNQDIADCFMGGYVKNPDLDHLVSWSDSYYFENGLALIVKKGSGISNALDLKGKKVAVYDDPAAISFLTDEVGAIAKPCIDTTDDGTWIKRELDFFGMDAVLYDYPFAISELNNLNQGYEKYKIIAYNLMSMPYVIGLPKSNDNLLQEINFGISQILNDESWYENLVRKYIPSPVIVAPAVSAPLYDRYIMQKGETFFSVAQKVFGNKTRWPELWELNKSHIPNPSLVSPGDVIIIPRLK